MRIPGQRRLEGSGVRREVREARRGPRRGRAGAPESEACSSCHSRQVTRTS